MRQFVVSARKYRPVRFREVMSQAHITTTLQNAIAGKKIAHAFLFCGPRGVGKTTCARIFAKAINCLQLTETIEPCNDCANCISFASNSSMNVYELDAASNNSVEDIRDLVDQIRYVPQIGKYKIYIIDEVHMLSNTAFNAFLKTLEEPPAYAIFILATTERHKILPTILSRCQIFNFNNIQSVDIVAQLKSIAIEESIAYEESALQIIAQKAEGAMRDALSMFDLIATSVGKDGTITYACTRDHLQLLDYDYYFKCTDALLAKDIATVLALYDSILRAGFNGRYFITGLGEHVRNLLVCHDRSTLPLLEVADHIRPSYAAHASRCPMPFLLHVLKLLNQCDIHYNAAHHQRLHVELTLIQMATDYLPDSGAVTGDAEYAVLSDGHKKKTADISHNTTVQPHVDIVQNNTDVQCGSNNTVPVYAQKTLVIPSLEALKASLTLPKKKVNSVLKAKPKTKEEKMRSRQEPIQKEGIRSLLDMYGEQLKKNGNLAGYYLLGQPIEVKNQVIIVSLINPVQNETFNSLKGALLVYLRAELHNDDITIQAVDCMQAEQVKKPYTDHEKLVYLSKKNAAIALMRAQLRLEIAY